MENEKLRVPSFYRQLFLGIFLGGVLLSIVIHLVLRFVLGKDWSFFFLGTVIFAGTVFVILVPAYLITRLVVLRNLEFERELAENEERYRLLADNVTDTIWTTDLQLNVTYISPSVERLRGFTVEEAMALPVTETLAPGSLELALKILSEELAAERKGDRNPDRTLTMELEVGRKDGSTIWVEMSMRFLRDECGQPVGLLGVTRDVSDRKKAEEELRKINEELDCFAQTVAHDLKGPITTIGLSSNTIRDLMHLPPSEDVEKKLEDTFVTMKRSVKQGATLVKDLLSLAEAGQIPEEVSEVDIAETVRNILKERSGELEARGVTVRVSDGLGSVVANPTHMYQVFANLINNAIRHGSSDDPVIQIKGLEEPIRGAHRFLVRDNGGGISEDELGSIFMPFFKGADGDTGIGLSTVKRIIEVYGGSINAYNDHGACFEFVLRDFE